jgi:hypothetical protein
MSATTKAAHTPGPWHYQDESDAYTHIVRGPKGEFVVSAPQDTSGTAEADTRLIAAAPEMLEALEGVLRVADRKTKEFDAARAAIQKAKGCQ